MATVFDPNSKQNEANQQQMADPTQLQTIGSAAPSGPVTTSKVAPAMSQPQGSGRFTNLQKYLQANKSGGQQVASKIGSNLQQNISKEQEAAQKYNQQLGQSVQAANQVAQQGAGYQQQLRNIGQDISGAQQAGFDARNQQQFGNLQNFVNDPNFGQFQNIQAGRAIDEGLLANQQQRAYQQAQQAAQIAGTARQQLGSEGGRFELLRNTFGGAARPGYTQGQQRLDQVLLGQGGGLGKVQADIGSLARDTQGQVKSAAEQANEVSRLAAQEQGLVGDINSQASANEKAYLDMLGGFVDPLNQQRAQEFQGLGSALNTYVPNYNEKTDAYTNKAYQPGLNEQQMAALGLTNQNQGVYNVFKDEAFTKAGGATDAEKYANIANVVAAKGREAQGFQDVANQSDVDRYASLAKIMGSRLSSPQLTKASDLGAAYTAKGDTEGGLSGRLSAAQKLFDEAAKKGTATGSYYGGQGRSENMQDIIDKGQYAYQFRDDTSPQWTGIRDTLEGNASFGYGSNSRWGDKATAQGLTNDWTDLDGTMSNQFRKFLENQNYNQTIGGQRQTYLDTLAAQAGGTPKAPTGAPITGVDPSIAYAESKLNKGK